jgi:hypothetical protein
VLVRVHIKRVVRAGLRAGFAADAAARVEINDSVFAGKKRRHRADFHARRVSAMIAAHHRKQTPRVRESAFFDIFNPRPINAERNVVFRFAGNGAGVAADTFAIINNKAEIHNSCGKDYYCKRVDVNAIKIRLANPKSKI